MLRPAFLLTCCLLLGTLPSLAQDRNWELDCTLQTPKLATVAQHLDPADPTTPKIAEWTYMYAVLDLANKSEGTVPVALSVGVLPMRGELKAGRWMPAQIAGARALAAIREAEGNEELGEILTLPSKLDKGESLQCFALLAKQLVPFAASGEPAVALAFPAEFEVVIKGLRIGVTEVEGRVVAVPKIRKTRYSFSDGSFSGGNESEWSDEELPGVDVGPKMEQWSRVAYENVAEAWKLDLQVERPRPVYVVLPPRGASDPRSLAERTQVYWYLRLRVENKSGKTRPLNLTLRAASRKINLDTDIKAQLEDPAVDPEKKAYLRRILGEQAYLPIENSDAYRAAASQEVERYGAKFGPVSYFDLPKRIEPMPEDTEGLHAIMRGKPVGAYDVIVLLSAGMDPRVNEFEIRVGGTRNQIEWLGSSATPAGAFPDRKLHRIYEEYVTVYRRYGSDEILSDPFRTASAEWQRLPATEGRGLRGEDLTTEVKTGGDGE